jgi:hypothetical protein
VRNRQQHDRTARQWTELYARPKPPILSSATPESTQLTATSKGKGKQVSNNNTSTSAASTSSATIDTITIEDSDDEIGGPSTLPRVAKSNRQSQKRKRKSVVEVAVDGVAERANSKRRAVSNGPTNEKFSTSGRITDGRRKNHRRPREVAQTGGAENIIVIED